MSTKARLVACVCGAAFASAFAAGPAAASPCATSTPASQVFADSPLDSDNGLSPEITSVTASLDSACNLSISYGIADGALIDSDALSWYLNTDGNPSTGNTTFGGADYAVMTLGRTGLDDPPVLAPWVNGAFDFAARKTLPTNGLFGFKVNVADLNGLTSGVPLTFMGGASWSGTYGFYVDWAPEVGAAPFSFPMVFSATAPVVQQAPPQPPVMTTVQPSTQAPVTPVSTPAAKTCTVPLVKGLSAAAARKRVTNAGCMVGATRYVTSKAYAGKVVRTTPARGDVLAGGARVSLVIGRRPVTKKYAKRRARAANASTTLARVAAANEAAARR